MQLSDSMQLTKAVFLLVFSPFKAQKYVWIVNKIQTLKKYFTTLAIIKRKTFYKAILWW